MRKIVVFFFFMLALLNTQAQTSSVSIITETGREINYTPAEIAAMKQDSAVMKDHDGNSHLFKGPAMNQILIATGVLSGEPLKGKMMAKYLLVSCADGYEVVFSLSELDPDFSGTKVIFAYESDGRPLAADRGPYRLVVPGDKRGARSAYSVKRISVLPAK